MAGKIHFFSEKEYVKSKAALEQLGSRGRLAMTFASLGLPVLPGVVLDTDYTSDLDSIKWNILYSKIKKIEKDLGKYIDSVENPLLYKIVICPNLAISNYPALHNFGLTSITEEIFKKEVGEDFCLQERMFLYKGVLTLEEKIAHLEEDEEKKQSISNFQKKIKKCLYDGTKEEPQVLDELFRSIEEVLGYSLFENAQEQLINVLKRIHLLLKKEAENLGANDAGDTAIIIQPMVYGNYGKNSYSGNFFTRNIVTGENKLQGTFSQEEFSDEPASKRDINELDKKYVHQLQEIARKLEDHYREIRSIRFTIEKGKLWLIDQRSVRSKSTQADIRTLMDLYQENKIKDKEVVNSIKANQLNELLHPVINKASVKDIPVIAGGISGASGAAIGRVFFSTESLLAEYKNTQQNNSDTRLILCLKASFAEDVKAIEVARGVLSTEGGYSAHASVVARQYGKISLVNTQLKIRGKTATLGEIKIKEGDYITLNVPYYGEPSIYLGEAELIEPDPEKNGLIEFIGLTKKFVSPDFCVRANADSGKDAALARRFGAAGIGLCRTEHMFFGENRINLIRRMIIAEDENERREVLQELGIIQEEDFYQIMKAMEGFPVTIRLLDAPLHEFVPHEKNELDGFIEELNKVSGKTFKRTDVVSRFEDLREFNPMLGHRGCRIAVSFPEIYEMQVSAILRAMKRIKEEELDVEVEIMVPLVMNKNELKLIVYGKNIEGKSYRGINEIICEQTDKACTASRPKIGTMIELPAAALGAGEIACYAEFFSFGTNDLTQTTIGLSRDDFNSFMPDYTQFDLMERNPFQLLDNAVKELISTAVIRGKMTRPELKKGLCGEHGAIPENIRFCMECGLDYVSCSAYSIPLALLAIAHENLKK